MSSSRRPKSSPKLHRSKPSAQPAASKQLPLDPEQMRLENERLRQENNTLRQDNDTLRQEIDTLRVESEHLRRQLQEALRASLRQAAPFRRSKKKRVEQPAKPGRKKGHPGTSRPRPDHVDRELVSPTPTSCPECSGPLFDLRQVEQFIEDIPPQRPEITRLLTWRGRCRCCGPISTSHPLQISQAVGAAGVHLGPRALALAMELVYRHGLPRRRACLILEVMTGLKLTPGGLCQAAERMAERFEGDYEAALSALRCSEAVYSDETSWWLNGKGAWLWVFTNAEQTIYRVSESRGRRVIHETLGQKYKGVLVSDCLASYDNATRSQHKCYAHHLRAIQKALEVEEETGRGRTKILEALKQELQGAMELKGRREEYSDEEWKKKRRSLRQRMDRLLRQGQACEATRAVANRLQRQRDHLFVFLNHGKVEATNNRAERALRPAVIARKLSAGNKSEQGAHTWQVLASMAATCTQKNQSFVDMVAERARPTRPKR